MVWQLQEAKARFSELVRRAVSDGPQRVSVRGEPTAVLVSEKDYRALVAGRPTLVDLIVDGAPWSDELVEAINDRSESGERDVDF